MSDARRSYRFATAAQWSACLFEGADRIAAEDGMQVRPLRPCGGSPVRFETAGAAAPAATEAQELWWRGDDGRLRRLAPGDDRPDVSPAPAALAGAQRIVASTRTLWAIGPGGSSLLCFDSDSLARTLSVDLRGARAVDIVTDGRDGVLALCARGSEWEILHADCAGQAASAWPLSGLVDPTALAYFPASRRAVVLAGRGTSLYGFAAGEPAARFRRQLGTVRAGFTASALCSDARSRLVVAGLDDAAFGGAPRVLVLDDAGNAVEDFAIESPATGLAATRDAVIVTDGIALLRFECAAVATGASESRCALLTPMLYSPEDDALRRWLRIEALAALPPGSSIELSYAATDDRDVSRRAGEIAAEAGLSDAERLRQLRAHLGPWTIAATFTGTEQTSSAASAQVPLAAPLHDVRARQVWVCATLVAAPGARLPQLARLEVRYGGPTLMDHLPALYRRSSEQGGSFLRALVGVLETTTQTLDARIAAMASLVHPSTASGEWLDYVAVWLGLPWDEAMATQQKRCIVNRAAKIAAGRGTRAGLEALLECLLPGVPRRFRVIDVGVDYGFATVGGGRCMGSRLPAVLTGAPRTSAALGESAIVGRLRLACPGRTADTTAAYSGRVIVDVVATAEERRAWSPWLATVLGEMLPVTARLRLRWRSAAAALYGDRLDGTLAVEPDPAPYLGTSAVTGLARLSDGRLPVLTASGVDMTARLR